MRINPECVHNIRNLQTFPKKKTSISPNQRNKKWHFALLTKQASPRTLESSSFRPFLSAGTFVSRISDNVIFLGFSWISRAPAGKKDRRGEDGTTEKDGRDRAIVCGKAPTTERTIYDVSPRNTLISNVSRPSSSSSAMVMPISYEGTLSSKLRG